MTLAPNYRMSSEDGNMFKVRKHRDASMAVTQYRVLSSSSSCSLLELHPVTGKASHTCTGTAQELLQSSAISTEYLKAFLSISKPDSFSYLGILKLLLLFAPCSVQLSTEQVWSSWSLLVEHTVVFTHAEVYLILLIERTHVAFQGEALLFFESQCKQKSTLLLKYM